MTTSAASISGLARSSASSAVRRATWAILACGAVMLGVQLPLLWKFFLDLWSRPQYEFFPLLLLAVPFVAMACLKELSPQDIRPGRAWIVGLWWAAAWLMLALAGVMYLRWLAPVAAWLTLAGCVWAIGGRALARALWPVAVLLLLILPPPGRYDETLLVQLRQLAVTCASRILDALNVPLFVHGAVIDIPDHRLMVEEACSGINSMLAVLAFTVLLVFWKRLPATALLFLLPAAAFFVFWANVFRIVACGFARERYDIDLLSGTSHELLGVGLFVACMALVFSTERLGQHIWKWDDRPEPTEFGQTNWTPVLPNVRLFVLAAVVLGVTGVATAWRTAGCWVESKLPPRVAFVLPDELAGWKRVADSDRGPEGAEVVGRHSQLFQYRRGDLLATVGIDYPFPGFHDATVCYRLAGWDITDTADHAADGARPNRFDVAMRKKPLVQGLMYFSLCDESGQWWRRPDSASESSMIRTKLRLARERAQALPLVQMQVLRVGYESLTDAEQAQLGELFESAAASMATNIRQWHTEATP